MMGIEFMGDIPFADVVIHSTIQAPDGRRMSKSLGTGIDPLELVDTYGADATRYGLLKMSSTQDVRFSAGMIEEGAKFANKLWNAARFVLTQADRRSRRRPAGTADRGPLDRSRLAAALDDVVGQIERYDFSAAMKTALRLRWYDFCDWYVGSGQAPPADDEGSAQPALGARAHPALTHPVLPVRDRGGLVAPARRARPSDAGVVSGGRRRPPRPGGRCDGREWIEFVTRARRPGHGGRPPGWGPDIRGAAPRRPAGDGAAATATLSNLERELPGAARARRAEGILAQRAVPARRRPRSRPSGRRRSGSPPTSAHSNRGWPRWSDGRRALHRLARALRHGLRARADARPARRPRQSRAVVRRDPCRGYQRQGLDGALRRGPARSRGRPHRRLPLAAPHIISRASPGRRRRDRPGRLRGGGAARA